MSYENRMVSVIIPAYNASTSISRCIESVLSQTYNDWEMIIVNDGSNDDTENVVLEYKKKDKRIKLINQDNNGVAVARNVAIKNSKGRYIAFLDADDLWKIDKLEKQISFMEENEYSFTFTGYETFNKETNEIINKVNVPKQIDYFGYLKNTIIGNLTVIMDRKLLGEVRIPEGNLEDVLTWMFYLKKGYIAYGLNEILAEYQISKESVSGNKIKNALLYFSILRTEQKIPFFKSLYYHFMYVLNAIKKRII